jgi:hypothetical protein
MSELDKVTLADLMKRKPDMRRRLNLSWFINSKKR